MDSFDVKRYALINSKNAELEAMKIENKIRLSENLSPAFGFDAFMEIKTELENLAFSHNEQL